METLNDGEGWSSETIYFLSARGTWTRLNLADLGLAKDAWPGRDMYGAGQLSPNGRTWLGRSDRGLVVVDLASAKRRVIDVGGGVNGVTWAPNSRDALIFDFNRSETLLVNTRTGIAEPTRFQFVSTGFAPDGGAVEILKDGSRGTIRKSGPNGTFSEDEFPAALLRGRNGIAASVGPSYLAVTPVDAESKIVALSRADLSCTATLAGSRTEYFTEILGWVRSTALLMTNRGVVAWDVALGETFRVALTEKVNPKEYASFDFSIATRRVK